MKSPAITSKLLALCLAVTVVSSAHGKRGTIFLDQIFKSETDPTTTTTSTTMTSTMASSSTKTVRRIVDGEAGENKNDTEESWSASANPINIQIFYPMAYPQDQDRDKDLRTTTPKKEELSWRNSRYPIIQIFNYQATPDITTTVTPSTTIASTTTTIIPNVPYPFQLIPLIEYPLQIQTTTIPTTTTVRPTVDVYGNNYASLLRSFLPFIPIGVPPYSSTSVSSMTESTKPVKTTKTTTTKSECKSDSCGKDEDDDEDDNDSDEPGTVFRPVKQIYNGNGYNSYGNGYSNRNNVNNINQYRQPMSNGNPFHYGSVPYYGNLPFSGAAPQYGGWPSPSQYNSNNCQAPYQQNYWDCIRSLNTMPPARPAVRKRTRKPRTKSTTIPITTTEEATSSTTTGLQQQYPFYQFVPFLIGQQQQTTTETPTTSATTVTRPPVIPYQLPFIHIIQIPQAIGSNGISDSVTSPTPTTTTSTTLITTIRKTAIKTTTKQQQEEEHQQTTISSDGKNLKSLSRITPLNISTSTPAEFSSSSPNTTTLNITILPSNMQCFAVNPECRSIMRVWTRMIPYSSVTRWTKRYWDVSTSSTAASPVADGATRTTHRAVITTPKMRRTTEFYYDYSEIDATVYFFGRCNVTVLDAGDLQLVNILFYVSSGWVIFWVLMILIINSVYREFGAHRWLDAYQEFGFVIVYLFMGVFVLKPTNHTMCSATTMVLLFFLVFNLSVAFMQTFWQSSLIKGSSERNGRLPILVNYVWPVMMATCVMLASYFTQRADYASTRVHCFCPLFSPLHWTFTVAAWSLWFLVLVRNQLAVTACRQSRPAVDVAQLYWAKKSCKGTPILISWFLMSFFALMFAVDLQLLWMSVAYVAVTALFGPALFYFHTQNHISTNNGLAARTYLALYRVCPLKRQKLLAASSHHHGGGGGGGRNTTGSGGASGRAGATGGGIRTSNAGLLHRSHSIETPNPASYRHPGTPPPFSLAGHRRQSAPGSVSGEPSPAPTASNAPPVMFVLPPDGGAGRGGASSGSHAANSAAATRAQLPPTNDNNMLSQPISNAGTAPTSAQVFYDWLMDRNEANIHESENILFRPPRPV